MEKVQWKRPQDVAVIRTSDPKEMVGKFLVKRLIHRYVEDFMDAESGEVVSLERSQVLMDPCKITEEKVSEILFMMQSYGIDSIEVCEHNLKEMELFIPSAWFLFNVTIHYGIDGKDSYLVYAKSINQAMTIASEFGQMYRGINGTISFSKVERVLCNVIPDDHICIPECDRNPEYIKKDYFKVQVRSELINELLKLKACDVDYIVTSKDVGEAKERVATYLEIERERGDIDDYVSEGINVFIRKAAPYNIDCVVPIAYSKLYE